MQNLLMQALQLNNITLPEQAVLQMVRYLDLMLQWNRVYNLTNITQPREMVFLHLIDSLKVMPFLHGKTALDIGTGAGLPGIPLALADASRSWTLLDKAGKKTRFLTQVIAELGLLNVKVVHARVEDFHSQASFDSILSRAYGSLRLFTESAGHLLAQDGKLIAMKGKYPQDELQDVPADFQVEDSKRLNIKGIEVERHIIVLKRIKRG